MLHAHLMGIGPFFEDVASRLPASSFAQTPHPSSIYDSTHWPAARARVFVTSGRDRSAEQHLEDVVWGSLQTLIPVQLEARSVRVGPVITPGRSACLRCFDRRQEQHGRRGATDVALDHAKDGTVAVTGHAPAHANMVATVLEGVTYSEERLLAAASSVWRFGFADLSVKEAVVIPVSGCRRCDRARENEPRSLHLSQYFPR
ncbi:TOMM precursor leader peptide-binding protein [Curtobacterium sp. MCBD17_019]|uniref:TOMM precursor leader peptide-binding protein n=1 Tax=Curtobacterium sp. MCBD17_019 TaxID=2175669 RepID=UPI000DA81163|nr:TOMM precursor leader peptide-binding protein [Curtobacterium sp. MCBD17_019]PZE78424.1 hypothetical protein DEI82_01260 [Curtobacterium sp. MCBD17_019]